MRLNQPWCALSSIANGPAHVGNVHGRLQPPDNLLVDVSFRSDATAGEAPAGGTCAQPSYRVSRWSAISPCRTSPIVRRYDCASPPKLLPLATVFRGSRKMSFSWLGRNPAGLTTFLTSPVCPVLSQTVSAQLLKASCSTSMKLGRQFFSAES
jgi:hypothetical protein